MKRRTKTSLAAAPAAGPRAVAKPPGRVWWLVGSIAVMTALGSGGAWAWRQHRAVTSARAALPARPDLTGQPAVFAGLLAKAEAATRSAGTLLDGVQELGRLYHANDFHREAESCWQLMRSEEPHEARWCYYLADLRRAASDYPEMTALLQETLRLAPDYAPARLQLANLQFKSGELEEAERNYQLRLVQLPQDPHARLGLVRLAMQRGRKDEVRVQLELLLQHAPHFSTGHNLYAELLAASGDAAGADKHRWLGRETLRYREAEDPWLAELQTWCYDYDRLCVFGTIELQTENRDRARAFFERAIELKPDEPQAYELLGNMYLKSNDPARARDILEQALPRLHGRKSPTFFTSLSLAYRKLKQPDEAGRVARLGLEQAGDKSELLDALALALADSGRHEEALAAWQAALAQSPGDAGMNFNMALSFLALRRLDDTLAALDRSLTLQPTFLPTLLLRGEIELDAGHLELAWKYLRPAYATHPEESQARRLLAVWHQQMGAAAESNNDQVAAERHYRDGLIIDNSNAELQVSLGAFLLVHARFTEAVGPLESYHRLQPDNAQGCLFLGQAYAASGRRDQAREILTKGAQLAEQSGNAKTANFCRELLLKL